MDYLRRRKIVREIDEKFDNKLGKTLEDIYRIQNGAVSINSLAQLLEGQKGLLGQIANVYNIDISGLTFEGQIYKLKKDKVIPSIIKNHLNNLRIHDNDIKHENASYTLKEAEILIAEVEAIFEWFYCKCERGPHLPAIFESNTILVAQVAFSKTVLGLADVGEIDNVKIKKIRILESDEFFHPQGFNFFRTTLSLFANGSRPEGNVISLSCPVNAEGIRQEHPSWQYWPTNVKEGLGLNTDTLIVNDAAAFGFSSDIREVNDRALVLILGIGIGGCILRNENGYPQIKPIEFGNEQFTLSGVSGSLHSLIGGDYFDKITRGGSYDSDQVIGSFSRRVIELIKILTKRYGIGNVVVGGYRSLFLSVPTLIRDLSFEQVSIKVLPNDEDLVNAMAKAWIYKFQNHHNFYSMP